MNLTTEHQRLSVKLNTRRPPILIHPRRHAEYGIHGENGLTLYLSRENRTFIMYRNGSRKLSDGVDWDNTTNPHSTILSFLQHAQEYSSTVHVTVWDNSH